MSDNRTKVAVPIMRAVFGCLYSDMNNGEKCKSKKCRINGGDKWPILDANIEDSGELIISCWGKEHL